MAIVIPTPTLVSKNTTWGYSATSGGSDCELADSVGHPDLSGCLVNRVLAHKTLVGYVKAVKSVIHDGKI
jgi:hypothetical protein